jgi:hypothetical protein
MHFLLLVAVLMVSSCVFCNTDLLLLCIHYCYGCRGKCICFSYFVLSFLF